MTDGSYKKVNAGGSATANYQKVWSATGHSAIVVKISGKQIVKTKMGGSPIYTNYLIDEFSGMSYSVYDRVC